MEQFLKWLPERPQPILVRYGSATLMVAVCFALMELVEAESGISCFFLLFPAIFLAALLFDRGSGFVATAISTLSLVISIQREGGPVALFEPYWLPLSLFFLVGLGLATLTELLRKGWERTVEAERVKDVLYRELRHRTKNDLAMAASVLNLQARSHPHEEVRDALATAVSRLLSLSKAHERLDPVVEGNGVQMHDYLDALCHALKSSMDHAPGVSLQVEGDDVELPVERAVPVGLIVNELVTNAYKHAFAGGQGEVKVSLRRLEKLTLIVQDNGNGCPEGAASGVGSQLVEVLVRQLNGSLQRTRAAPGCRVSVSFPDSL
jgi:two-component system, sensor histidine kinase PdtaS